MGGGGAGAISHSAYMETAHKDMLNRTLAPGVGMNRSIVEVMSTALTAGSSPFLGSLAYSPDADFAVDAVEIGAFRSAVYGLDYVIDPSATITAMSTLIPVDTTVKETTTLNVTTLPTDTLDTTGLDIATLDTATLATALTFTDVQDVATLSVATLDTFVVSTAQVDADVLAYSNVLESDLNLIALPRYRAGMFNINAVVSSAFVLGEAVLRAEKLRQVAHYTADLRSKLFLQADEINAKFMSERREIDARFQIQFRELNARFAIQHKDKATEYNVLNQTTTMHYNTQFQELTARYKLQFAEITERFKMQYQEISSKFKMQHKDKTTEYQIQYRDLNAKFALQYSELDARFKMLYREITSRHALDRWANIRHGVQVSMNELMKKGELSAEVLRYTLETNRLKTIAKSEQAQEQLLINEHNAKWDLEVFQYGTAVLGGIGGGAFIPGKKSKAVSALAGGLGGAAAGASVGAAAGAGGGPYGAAIGGVVGALAGYFGAA